MSTFLTRLVWFFTPREGKIPSNFFEPATALADRVGPPSPKVRLQCHLTAVVVKPSPFATFLPFSRQQQRLLSATVTHRVWKKIDTFSKRQECDGGAGWAGGMEDDSSPPSNICKRGEASAGASSKRQTDRKQPNQICVTHASAAK
jgi:hypothetical protein